MDLQLRGARYCLGHHGYRHRVNCRILDDQSDPATPLIMMAPFAVSTGCACWSLWREKQAYFPAGANRPSRYAERYNAVAISSAFYRTHLPSAYRRRSGNAPENLRFPVAMPERITHKPRTKARDGLVIQVFNDANNL